MSDFLNKEEYEEVRAKRIGLEAKLQFRLDFEKKYEQQKLFELDKELEMIKKSNQIANSRNENILRNIQMNLYSNFQKSKISNHSKSLLVKEKNKYKEYLATQTINLQNEYKLQLKAKHNEILTVKTLMQEQINRNNDLFNIEKQFLNNMNEANNKLNQELRNLAETNLKIEEERKNILIQQTKIENQTKEKFFELITSNIRKEQDLNSLLKTQLNNLNSQKENIKESNDEQIQKKREENLQIENKVKESIEIKKIKELQNEEKPQLEEKKKPDVPKTKPIPEKPLNIIDKIRFERLKEKKEKENVNKNSLDQDNFKSFRENANNEEIQKNNNQDQFDEFETGNDREFNNKKKDSPKEIVNNHKNEESVRNSGNFQKKKTVEDIVGEKKPFDKLSKEYKIRVAKRIISYLEQFSKTKKPSNFIYSLKIINPSAQKLILDLFYEILGNDQFDFSISDPEVLINVVGELIYTNPNPNLNQKEFKKSSESEFDSIIDDNIKELFTLLIDHLKKMVKEQKTSLQISSNFLTQKINNFSNSSETKNKLLPIMEKKLSATKAFLPRENFTGGFSSAGFGGLGNNSNAFKQTKIPVRKDNTSSNLFDQID